VRLAPLRLAVVLALATAAASACANPAESPSDADTSLQGHRAAPDRAITGTTWTVTGFLAGEEISAPPALAQAGATFKIEPDGTVRGNGGCNQFFGSAEVAGPDEGREAKVVFQPMATTMRACLDAAVGDVEAAVLAALNGPAVFTVSGNDARLTRPDGSGLALTGWPAPKR
jgi:heat shock protein HslJ